MAPYYLARCPARREYIDAGAYSIKFGGLATWGVRLILTMATRWRGCAVELVSDERDDEAYYEASEGYRCVNEETIDATTQLTRPPPESGGS